MTSCVKCGKVFVDKCFSCYDQCAYCGQEKSIEDQACKYCVANQCVKCHNVFSWLETECPKCAKKKIGREKTFSQMLTNAFELAQLSKETIATLLAREKDFELAFTAKSFDSVINNELLEFQGDAHVNSAFVKYVVQRFPQLNCSKAVKIFARLKINNVSRDAFAEIASELGFAPFIKASPEHLSQDLDKLLEDVFEAFIAVIVNVLDERVIGCGFNAVYHLIKAIFDERRISLAFEDLYDAKSRLKELVDHYPDLGKLLYENVQGSTIIHLEKNGKRQKLSQGGNAPTLIKRQQDAARLALDTLAGMGFSRTVDFALPCE